MVPALLAALEKTLQRLQEKITLQCLAARNEHFRARSTVEMVFLKAADGHRVPSREMKKLPHPSQGKEVLLDQLIGRSRFLLLPQDWAGQA